MHPTAPDGVNLVGRPGGYRVKGVRVDETFEAFVAARGQALWRTAWLLTGDHALAQDLVQTALAKAWPRFDRVVRSGGSFEAYVRRILVTTYATWWRRKWRGEQPTPELPDVAHAGDDEETASVRMTCCRR